MAGRAGHLEVTKLLRDSGCKKKVRQVRYKLSRQFDHILKGLTTVIKLP